MPPGCSGSTSPAMAVLVTGASGVVGVHAARALAADGHRVVAFSTSGRTPVTASLLDDMGARITYAAGDVRDPDAVAEVVRTHRIDAIVHAAGLTGEAQARARPLDMIAVNVTGTANVLEAARSAGVRRVVYVGSSAEYGRRPDLAAIGEDEVNPEGLYAETKHLGFRLARRYRAVYGLDTLTCRINSVYGPGTRFNRFRGLVGNTLVAHLCRAVARGEPVHLESGGDYPRGWTHAGDVADGIRRMVEVEAPAHDVYNLASGRIYTVRQVVDALHRVEPAAEISIGAGAWEDDPFQAGNVRGPLDIGRARADLGFQPRVELEDGLRAYVAWWRRMPD
jgi:UDP-glucose 4-epimerase